jgi:hypothetical protein
MLATKASAILGGAYEGVGQGVAIKDLLQFKGCVPGFAFCMASTVVEERHFSVGLAGSDSVCQRPSVCMVEDLCFAMWLCKAELQGRALWEGGTGSADLHH